MQEHLDRVATRLEELNIDLTLSVEPTAAAEEVAGAEHKLHLRLPHDYVEFVTSFANGLSVLWSAGDGPVSHFQMPPVMGSVGALLDMRDWRFYSEDAATKYGFPYTDDPELAVVTNRLMHNWLPFHAESNGDFFSINLNVAGHGEILFDQHDWLDGGTGQNGFVMADTFREFIESWASVCFSQPTKGGWKSVIVETGVDWNSDRFDERFRL